MHPVATAPGDKPGQIDPTWLLGKCSDFAIVPIPGTKRRQYLEENVAAVAIKLDRAEMAALDEPLALGKIAGPRYGERGMAMVDR